MLRKLWGDKQAWKIGTLVFFWLHWVFVAALRLSLVAASGGYSLAAVHGLLTALSSSLVKEDRL